MRLKRPTVPAVPLGGLTCNWDAALGITYGNSAVTSAGTTPPVITINAGTFTSATTITIACTLGGARGTWTGTYSVNGGAAQAFTSAATVSITGGNGVTSIAIAAGTSNTNNVWSFQSTMVTWADTLGYATIGHNTTNPLVNYADSSFANLPSVANIGGAAGAVLSGNYDCGTDLTGGVWTGNIALPFTIAIVLRAAVTNQGEEGIYSDPPTNNGLYTSGSPADWQILINDSGSADTGIAQNNSTHCIITSSSSTGSKSATWIDNSASSLASGNVITNAMAGMHLFYVSPDLWTSGGYVAAVLAWNVAFTKALASQTMRALGAKFQQPWS